LSNVIDNLSAEIKEKQKQKDARDAKLMEEIKQRESLQEFLKKCEKIDKERGKS
jgi:hypothetical protein